MNARSWLSPLQTDIGCLASGVLRLICYGLVSRSSIMAHPEMQAELSGRERSLSLQLFACAGVVGPTLFVLLFTIAGFLYPGYSPISQVSRRSRTTGHRHMEPRPGGRSLRLVRGHGLPLPCSGKSPRTTRPHQVWQKPHPSRTITQRKGCLLLV